MMGKVSVILGKHDTEFSSFFSLGTMGTGTGTGTMTGTGIYQYSMQNYIDLEICSEFHFSQDFFVVVVASSKSKITHDTTKHKPRLSWMTLTDADF